MVRAVVTGAGGFLGHHLAQRLKDEGYWVRGVDIKWPEFAPTPCDEFLLLDLRERDAADIAVSDMEECYALAADMGGMGFISTHHAQILHNNALINLNTFEAAHRRHAGRVFYASSACVYPEYKQMTAGVTPNLKEEDAWPAQPQDAYGLEKLTSEELAMHYARDYGMTFRIARFHNIYGPLGTWRGGREKAPAAMCRKVAVAAIQGGPVEVWGDGTATRSYCYVDDAIEGVRRLMRSDYAQPLNIGSEQAVTVNDLLGTVCAVAGVEVETRYVAGPVGVLGRNSDNTRCRAVLQWEPTTSLRYGIEQTYPWIEQEVSRWLTSA